VRNIFENNIFVEYSQIILKNKFVFTILAYLIFVSILIFLKNNKIASRLGLYSVSIPVWIVILLFLILAYMSFRRLVQYVIYGSVALGVLLLIIDPSAITSNPPMSFILSSFMLFVTLSVFTLLSLGFIGAFLVGGVSSSLTQSGEAFGIAALLGFCIALLATWEIYSRAVLPFSFGFLSSIISAELATAFSSSIFLETNSRIFSLPFPFMRACISSGNIWNAVKVMVESFFGFFSVLWHHNAVLFVASVIVGIAVVWLEVSEEDVENEDIEPIGGEDNFKI